MDWNFTMGLYDAIAKVEFSYDYTAATVILTIDKLDNSTSTALKDSSEAEMKKIVENSIINLSPESIFLNIKGII